MENKKENKKGFWASLFSPKPCSCSCGDNLIIEEVEKPTDSCCCGDNAATTKTGIKEVKILGPGCAKCKTTYRESNQREQSRCEAHENRGYYRNHEL